MSGIILRNLGLSIEIDAKINRIIFECLGTEPRRIAIIDEPEFYAFIRQLQILHQELKHITPATDPEFYTTGPDYPY